MTLHLICAGAADAIEFYKKAFDAVDWNGWRVRKAVHARSYPHWRFGGDARRRISLMAIAGPKSLESSPVTILHLDVNDADAVVEKAVRAGAKITMPLEDTFWGDRYGKLEDPLAIPRRCHYIRESALKKCRKRQRK